MALAAVGCSSKAKLAGDGAPCALTTDCEEGLVCIALDGARRCSSDLTSVQDPTAVPGVGDSGGAPSDTEAGVGEGGGPDAGASRGDAGGGSDGGAGGGVDGAGANEGGGASPVDANVATE